DRHAEPHRHARDRHEFSPTGPNRRRLAGPDALATRTATHLFEPGEIGVDFPAQPLREVLPCWAYLGLDRRLGELLHRPPVDRARAGIPRPRHRTPSGVV